jgi:hypothetical protein
MAAAKEKTRSAILIPTPPVKNYARPIMPQFRDRGTG